jgi:Protein of unknown function (DUF3072)
MNKSANNATKARPQPDASDDGPTLEHPKRVAGDASAAATGNLQKEPEEWVTGDEQMTMAQASYLKTLCEEAGEEYDATLTKAQASRRIDELQAVTGRGKPAHAAE